MDIPKETILATLILLFLIVTFLQSGWDKLTDWQGNSNFIKTHFAQSPLKNVVPLLLGIIMMLEILSGLLMIVGIYTLWAEENNKFAFYGIALSALTLVFLLIGQRLAKDYAGAMSLAVYFIVCVLGMFALM